MSIQRVIQAALELRDRLEELKPPYCFIGGVAVQRWGEPRLTVDAHATVLTGWDRERDWVDIDGVLRRQGKKLNVGLIGAELHPLVELKEEPAILERLARLRRKHAACIFGTTPLKDGANQTAPREESGRPFSAISSIRPRNSGRTQGIDTTALAVTLCPKVRLNPANPLILDPL